MQTMRTLMGVLALAAAAYATVTLSAKDTSTNVPAAGGSLRVAWTAEDASGSLENIFTAGAVIQPTVNGTILGSPTEPWLVGPDGTRASGEATLPLPFAGIASIDLVLIKAPVEAPILGKTIDPAQVLARLTAPLKATVTPFVAPAKLPAGGPAVTMWWEPWFTPKNFAAWPWAEAQPSMGTYDSSEPAPARQHALWLSSASVTNVGVDWTNNLWGCDTFSCRPANAMEIINATQLAVGVWEGMRSSEGIAAPASLLLTGLDNGPKASPQAVQEQAEFAAAALLHNASAGGAASSMHDPVTGDPLLVVFDGSLADHRAETSLAGWAIRWMGSQLQERPSAATQLGYWSWMDGTEAAVITPPAGAQGPSSGAVTVSSAFFAGAGWTGAGALGKRGGATLVESLALVGSRTGWLPGGGGMALRFLFVNQWNEFAGQANGGGYGPNKTDFVDIFSSELGNDMEPTDLRTCGYRRWGVACGGYGWRQLNLLRWGARWAADPAGAAGNETMLFVTWPPVGWAVNSSATVELRVLWALFDDAGMPLLGAAGTGAPPAAVLTVAEVFAGEPGLATPLPVLSTGPAATVSNSTPPAGTSLVVPAPQACSVDSNGLAVLRVCASGSSSRWPLSLREDDGAAAGTGKAGPACVEHAVACGV